MGFNEVPCIIYKIIIPQEEPKQENCCTPVGQIKRYVDCKGCGKEPKQSVEEYTQQGLEKYFEEPEQETLEEAIKQELENHFFSNISEIKQAEYFINFGAKWQQEQDKKMYSEEDLEVAYFSGIKTTGEGWNGEYANGNNPSIEEEFQEGFQEWFNQFKKK
jgi:hypothetical protein